MSASWDKKIRDALDQLIPNLAQDLDLPTSLGEGDVTTARLDNELLACKAVLASLNHRLQSAKYAWNASARVNLLPQEISHHIFIRALTTNRNDRKYYTDVLRLRQVCKSWHDSIGSNPHFWTQLSNLLPKSRWRFLLEKSLDAPLCMAYFFDGYEASSDEEKVDGLYFLQTAYAQTRRLRSFRYLPHCSQTEDQILLLEKIMESPAPLLEEVFLDCREFSLALEGLFAGEAPSLRVISWADLVKPPLHAEVLKGLEALDVGLGWEHLPLDAFFNILRASPRLVHLRLYRATFKGAYPTAVTPILLLRLQTLILQELNAPFLTCLFSWIQAPNCLWTKCLLDSEPSDPEEFNNGLCDRIAQHATHALLKPPNLEPLQIRSWEEGFSVNGAHFELRSTRTTQTTSFIAHVLNRLPTTNMPTVLTIDEGVDHQHFKELLQALRTVFPGVAEIRLPMDSIATFSLQTLLSPLDKPSSASTPSESFPGLRRIVALRSPPSYRELRALIDIAQFRNGVEGVGAAECRRLDSIHVTPDSRYTTPCFRRMKRDSQNIVEVVCDAPWVVPEGRPRAWEFWGTAENCGLSSPLEGVPNEVSPSPDVQEDRRKNLARWVDEESKYEVSTSDEEEPVELAEPEGGLESDTASFVGSEISVPSAE